MCGCGVSGLPPALLRCYPLPMSDELTKEEVERRAREVARTLMKTPYQKQEWPRKPRGQTTKEQTPEKQPSEK